MKRGTVSARNITLLIDYCVNYYCGPLFNYELLELATAWSGHLVAQT